MKKKLRNYYGIPFVSIVWFLLFISFIYIDSHCRDWYFKKKTLLLSYCWLLEFRLIRVNLHGVCLFSVIHLFIYSYVELTLQTTMDWNRRKHQCTFFSSFIQFITWRAIDSKTHMFLVCKYASYLSVTDECYRTVASRNFSFSQHSFCIDFVFISLQFLLL